MANFAWYNEGMGKLKYAGVLLAGGLYIWALIFLLNADNWVGISAISTMILAIAAFWTIRNSREQEKRDRKERLLNDIIEWAVDVTRVNFGCEISVTVGLVDKTQKR